jgi:hypothetical protein
MKGQRGYVAAEYVKRPQSMLQCDQNFESAACNEENGFLQSSPVKVSSVERFPGERPHLHCAQARVSQGLA